MIAQAREGRGWKQKDLAKALGTTQPTVSRWERNEAVPSIEFRQKLKDVLGLDLDDIYMAGEREAASRGEGWEVVNSDESVMAYINAVIDMEQSDQAYATILMKLASKWMNKRIWAASVTRGQLVDELGEDKVIRYWERVLASPWVDQIEGPEYILQLRYPS
ncbi:MAG: helix-turn-helix transcriptional regulator [Bradymonadaceae bacterium]